MTKHLSRKEYNEINSLAPKGHRYCMMFKKYYPISDFSKVKSGYRRISNKWYSWQRSLRLHDDTAYVKEKLRFIKRRAFRKNIKFNLTLENCPQLPKKCPVTNKPFIRGEVHKYNPSLDRIDSNKGYTPDNVWWICWMANSIKGPYSIKEVELVLKGLKKNKIE